MKAQKLFVSTIDALAGSCARRFGLGVEIAQFCTAANMDQGFRETDRIVREQTGGIERRIFHGPFNELFPCAIDPKARNLTMERFRQASDLAAQYGANQIIFHAGFVPNVYVPCWFTEQSVLFWRAFLQTQGPDKCFCLENVMEADPQWLKEIVSEVADPRLGICLDVGHANVCSTIDVFQWMECLAPWIRHFHIHNNDGTRDDHGPLDSGSIPMARFLKEAAMQCQNATFTLEVPDGEPEIRWLLKENILED